MSQVLYHADPPAAASNDNVKAGIPLSINRRIIDKNVGGDTLAFSGPWEAYDLSVGELAEHVSRGHAFSAVYKNEIRKGTNFLRAGFVASDIDGTMTLEAAKSNDFIRNFGSLLYTTPNHLKDGKDRFRVVFATQRNVSHAKEWANALLGLAIKLGSDLSATDSARLFYGSRDCEIWPLGNRLSDEALAELIELGSKYKAEKKAVQRRSFNFGLSDASETAIQFLSPDLKLRTGTGSEFTIDEAIAGVRVLCPFHDDDSPSAFIVQSAKGGHGLHCSACKMTWWQKKNSVPLYDYYSFERAALEALANPSAHDIPMANSNIERLNARFLPGLPHTNGVTFTRSPKGTGKTEKIRHIVAQAKALGQSVLLIGHRRTLLRELSKRLMLHCYLDDEIPILDRQHKAKKYQRPNLYAVSVDSLPTRLGNPRSYSVVIVDESEQVFSHVASTTIRNPQQVLHRLMHYIGTAEALYLFDADLNEVTYKFVTACRRRLLNSETRIILNQFVEQNRPYDLFESRDDLVDDLIVSLDNGKRVFVACNSRKKAETLRAVLAKHSSDNAKIMLVTSETKPEQNVADFLTNVSREILAYDVTIASPAIGTGIDISFPNGAAMIDVVYGFFETGINSHYDIDQQLGRVRNPGTLRVWVAPQRFRYEVSPETVLKDIEQSGDAEFLINGFTKDGNPNYDTEHPALKLYAEVYCAQRGSQNSLRDLFVAHRERNGWRSNLIEKKGNVTSASNLRKIEEQVLSERIEAIVNASKLAAEDYDQSKFEQEQGQSVGTKTLLAMRRFEIEDFYGQAITSELVQRDNDGSFRPRVTRFARLRGLMGKYTTIWNHWSNYLATGMIGKAFGKTPDRVVLGVFCAAELVREGGFDTERHICKDDLSTFVEFCRKQNLTLQRDLGILLKPDFEKYPIKALNTLLALVGLKVEMVQQRKIKGRKAYFYALSQSDLAVMEQIHQVRTKTRLKKGGDPKRLRRRIQKAKAAPPDALSFFDIYDE